MHRTHRLLLAPLAPQTWYLLEHEPKVAQVNDHAGRGLLIALEFSRILPCGEKVRMAFVLFGCDKQKYSMCRVDLDVLWFVKFVRLTCATFGSCSSNITVSSRKDAKGEKLYVLMSKNSVSVWDKKICVCPHRLRDKNIFFCLNIILCIPCILCEPKNSACVCAVCVNPICSSI